MHTGSVLAAQSILAAEFRINGNILIINGDSEHDDALAINGYLAENPSIDTIIQGDGGDLVRDG